MNHEAWGRGLIAVGGGVFFIGVLVYFFGNKLGWVGRLPGDVAYRGENVRFYFPLTSLLLLNVLIWGILRIYTWLKK